MNNQVKTLETDELHFDQLDKIVGGCTTPPPPPGYPPGTIVINPWPVPGFPVRAL